MPKTIDPDVEGMHPLRHTLGCEDWDRIERVIQEDSDEHVTPEELLAYEDWMYDAIAMKLQTVDGTTTLQ
jgi:hypothetical protein|tara:strand:+ start:239 stop:448 length:210 start_codon:yes stop_codon:yes gene_type:complete